MHTNLLHTFVVGVAFGIVSCGESADDSSRASGGTTGPSPTGGEPNHATGGTAVIGSGEAGNAGNPSSSLGGIAATGGSGGSGSTAGATVGGAAAGGNSATGGAPVGGAGIGGKSGAGGAASGGKPATGGAATGGNSATGGAATGGSSATGGTTTGGSSATGGTATGGNSANGGAATGGSSASGGAATGGAGTGGTTGSDPCSATNTLSGGTPHCNENSSGDYGSYQWRLWSNQTTGCLTTYSGVGAAFSASWDNSGDFLAGVGLVFDGTQTHEEIGVFSADFAETKAGDAGAYSYIGVYGWTDEPVVEFFIVEDSFNPPPTDPGIAKLGVIEADGSSYDVYYQQATGTKIMYQAYGVRRDMRHCGHISISDHFSKWADLGIQLGKMGEVSLLVESGGGTGSIDFTTASVVVD